MDKPSTGIYQLVQDGDQPSTVFKPQKNADIEWE